MIIKNMQQIESKMKLNDNNYENLCHARMTV